MKSVIVSYGHVDPVLPLFRHLSKHTSCDLILVFTQRQKYESILSFDDLEVDDGFINYATTRRILKRIGLEDTYPSIRIFVYHNNRTRSPKNFWLSLQLRGWLKNYDVIHFNGQHTTLVPLLCLLPRGKNRLLFTIHDYKPHYGEGGKHKLFGCYWTNSFILSRRWPVVIQNKADYKLLLEEMPYSKNQIFYIPFSVFENYSYWADSEIYDCKYDLLFCGRISKYKGLNYLLEAVARLQRDRPGTSLCIAGNGDLAEYRDLIGKVSSCTVINRYIPSRELVYLLQSSKCVVCPYTDATQSGVVMTAFAIGKPVIATDVGGFSDAIIDGQNGFLVKPKDVNGLREKIQQLLDNELLRIEMVKKAKAFGSSREFNWDNIAAKYFHLYNSLLHNENSDSR